MEVETRIISRLYKICSLEELELYIGEFMNICGCSEIEPMIEEYIKILEWAQNNILNNILDINKICYEKLYPDNLGVFYIIANQLDSLGFLEHGSTIRYAWTTSLGNKFLSVIKKYYTN